MTSDHVVAVIQRRLYPSEAAWRQAVADAVHLLGSVTTTWEPDRAVLRTPGPPAPKKPPAHA